MENDYNMFVVMILLKKGCKMQTIYTNHAILIQNSYDPNHIIRNTYLSI